MVIKVTPTVTKCGSRLFDKEVIFLDRPNYLNFETKQLPGGYDDIAPDGSEIRLLLKVKGGSMVHCTLLPRQVSRAVRHKTIEEIWYFIEGHGEVWRKQGDRNEVVEVKPGVCVTIPTGTHFQFRNIGNEPLRFMIVTIPCWPGEGEAVEVEGYWEEKVTT